MPGGAHRWECGGAAEGARGADGRSAESGHRTDDARCAGEGYEYRSARGGHQFAARAFRARRASLQSASGDCSPRPHAHGFEQLYPAAERGGNSADSIGTTIDENAAKYKYGWATFAICGSG